MQILNNFIQGIMNLWYYRSVIWNDRWYDYSFMLRIWERKLQNISDSWKDAHYEGCEADEDDIKQALFLIKMLIEDDFDMAEMIEIDREFGELEIADTGVSGDDVSLKRKLETPDNKEEINQRTLSAIYIGEARKKDAQEELFNILKGYERWWD